LFKRVLLVSLVSCALLFAAFPAFAATWNQTFQTNSEYSTDMQVAASGFNYCAASSAFPADPTMLALTSKGDISLSPNAGGLWVQAQFVAPSGNTTEKPTVVSGAARAYLPPDFTISQLAVLSGPGGLYAVNVSYGIMSNPNGTESQLQFGDSVNLTATNITPPSTPGGASSSFYAFAFGPGDVMYASNGESVYKSQDQGKDWTMVTILQAPVESIVLSPNFASDQTMFFATQSGVFESMDAGQHFKQVSLPVTSDYTVAFSPNYAQDQTIAAVVPTSGLYLSTDMGTNWTQVINQTGPLCLALSKTAIYVGMDASAGQMKGVYASFDQGKTWLSEGMTDVTKVVELTAVSGANGDTVYALPQYGLVEDATIAPPPAPTPAPLPAQPATQSNTAVFTIGSTAYTVNGQANQMDVAPVVDVASGRTLVPVRYLAEALGVASEDITWDAGTGTVTLATPSTTIVLTIGSQVMKSGSGSVQMDIAPMIINGRTMLPARWVAQAMGYVVTWKAGNQTVTVTPPGNQPSQGGSGGPVDPALNNGPPINDGGASGTTPGPDSHNF